MTKKIKIISLIIIAVSCFLFAKPVSATKRLNWHDEYKSKWKIIDIKKNQISKLINFKNSGGLTIGGTTTKGGRWCQGSTITPRHIVWASWKNNDTEVQIVFADRNPPYHIQGYVSGHFEHAPLTYNWKRDEVVVGGDGNWTYISDKTMKKTRTVKRNRRDFAYNNKYDAYNVGDKFYTDDWHTVSGIKGNSFKHGLIPQQQASYNDYIYRIANDWGCGDWPKHGNMHWEDQDICWPGHGGTAIIYAININTGELEKTFVVNTDVYAEELESISFDENGDMYLAYNKSGVTFFKISHEVLKTSPSEGGSMPSGGSNPDTDNKDNSGNSGKDVLRRSREAMENPPDINIAPDNEIRCTSILDPSLCESDDGSAIQQILIFIIETMSIGVGTIGAIGFMRCGYIIMTARDNVSSVEKAKTRILEIVIGIIAWALLASTIYLITPRTEVVDTVLETVEVIEFSK